MGDDIFMPALLFIVAGLVGGIVLFSQGLVAYRRDRLISSVASSSLDGIAAGEVRVTGVVEPIDHTLISALQSRPCVWYHSRIEETGDNARTVLDEEKSQEFRLRDGTGEIRVVPRGARWEIGAVFDESTDMVGEDPPGLRRRTGSTYARYLDRDPTEMTEVERQAAIQALLTPQGTSSAATGADFDEGVPKFSTYLRKNHGRRYREARLEPGDTVTVLGQAWPWGEVREVVLTWNPGSNIETAIAGDIAIARATGTLAASPEEAWGNAAIPGFGIGIPTLRPELDPRAEQPEVNDDPDAHSDALEKYRIPDEELVLSRGLKGGLAIYAGDVQAATTRHDLAFVVGVMGAVMAVVCALALGAMLTGELL